MEKRTVWENPDYKVIMKKEGEYSYSWHLLDKQGVKLPMNDPNDALRHVEENSDHMLMLGTDRIEVLSHGLEDVPNYIPIGDWQFKSFWAPQVVQSVYEVLWGNASTWDKVQLMKYVIDRFFTAYRDCENDGWVDEETEREFEKALGQACSMLNEYEDLVAEPY